MENQNNERVYLMYSVIYYCLTKKKIKPSEIFELKENFLTYGIDAEDAEHPLDYDELVEYLKVEEVEFLIEILEYLTSYISYEGFILPQRIRHYYDLLRETGTMPFDFWEKTYEIARSNFTPRYLDLPA